MQVNLVNLFATVRDKKTKRIVPDLTKDDFKISEDGKDQTIVSFSRDSTLPVTLGVLIDTSGSEQYMLPAEQDAMSRFLARVMRKNDLAMVISFDSDANLLEDFTDDQDRLSRSIHRARINAPVAQGPFPLDIPGTVFYDAVYLACHDELADQPGRRAIVVVSDAQDEGSKLKAAGRHRGSATLRHGGAHIARRRSPLWRRKRSRGQEADGRNRRAHHRGPQREKDGGSLRRD